MNLKRCLKTIAGFGMLLGIISCQSKATTPQQVQAPEVSVTQVKAGEGEVKNTYAASIEGTMNIEVRPQTSGYLSKIYVDEGAYVRAGQPLFQIDERPFVEQFKTAKAAVAVAEANLRNVKIDLDRKVELVDNKIVSDLQVTQATASFEAAKASLEQAKAAMNAAKINVDFCLIKAPVSGYIGRIPYRLGSLVSAASVEPLTLLTDINQVYAYFSMSEGDFANFQDMQASGKSAPVSLVLANDKAYEHAGTIDAITGQFDKNTGSISIRAKFVNPDKKLRAGNTGRIEMVQHLDHVVMVPMRQFAPYHTWIRISIGLPEENRKIQDLLKEFYKQ